MSGGGARLGAGAAMSATAPSASPSPSTPDEDFLAAVVRSLPELRSMDRSGLMPLTRLVVATPVPAPLAGASDPAWKSLPTIGPLILEPRKGYDAETSAQVAYDGSALYVRVACRGSVGRTMFTESWWDTDTVELFLDPHHDHERYLHLAVLAGGQARGFRARRPHDNQRCENKRRSEPLPAGAWRGERLVNPDGWTAFLAVPFALLGAPPEPGRPLGFNLLRHRSIGIGTFSIYNWTTQGPHAPWGWADLAFGEPSLHVERVDLGELRLWENRGFLHVRNRTGADLAVTVGIEVRSGERGECLYHRGAGAARIPVGEDAARIPVAFPLDPEDWKWNEVRISLVDAAGELRWSGGFRFGYGNTWLLQLDDRREGPPPPDPVPGEPDFMAKKRRFILGRQPRFLRRTTAQGAPSDVTLEAADGSVRFDLMRAGELRRIADWLSARYDTEIDRLLGATLFVHQAEVVRYSNAANAFSDGMGALSVLRFGAGQCSAHAEALCGILERMTNPENGEPYNTTRVTTHAHVTTIVKLAKRWVFLDPSFGRFYFLADDRTLASLQDLLADPALGCRGAKHMDEYLRKTADNGDLPNFYRSEGTVWPTGAPAE
jgi:hypothetical protein